MVKKGLCLALIVIGIVVVGPWIPYPADVFPDRVYPTVEIPTAGPECEIKGVFDVLNRRIYYLPGDRNYERVTVYPQYGERYFCSELEAETAGFRRR